MDILDPKQQEELERLNRALVSQSLQPEDRAAIIAFGLAMWEHFKNNQRPW